MICNSCNAEVAILHPRPSGGPRAICGTCQGKANRAIADQLRDAVRALKYSNDHEEERAAIDTLQRLSPDDADATVKYIAERRATGAYKEKRHDR